jgi:hypothetical protein
VPAASLVNDSSSRQTSARRLRDTAQLGSAKPQQLIANLGAVQFLQESAPRGSPREARDVHA